jgi:hypothetical protein
MGVDNTVEKEENLAHSARCDMESHTPSRISALPLLVRSLCDSPFTLQSAQGLVTIQDACGGPGVREAKLIRESLLVMRPPITYEVSLQK